MNEPALDRSFRGHKDAITSVAISPNTAAQQNSRLIATGSRDKSVILWKVSNSSTSTSVASASSQQQQLRAYRLIGHKSAVTSVAFSPGGNLLASSSNDTTVKLWNPNEACFGHSSASIKVHSSNVKHIEFHPKTGRLLLTCSDDKSIKLWSIPSLCFTNTVGTHNSWVNCSRFSTDGRLIASCGDDSLVKIWDYEHINSNNANSFHIKPIISLTGHIGPVTHLSWIKHQEKDTLVSCGRDGAICLWDARTRGLVQHYPTNNSINCIDSHPIAGIPFILSSGTDGILRIWDIRNASVGPCFELNGHEGSVLCARWSPGNGDYIISGGEDQTAMLWRSNTLSNLENNDYLQQQTSSERTYRAREYSNFHPQVSISMPSAPPPSIVFQSPVSLQQQQQQQQSQQRQSTTQLLRESPRTTTRIREEPMRMSLPVEDNNSNSDRLQMTMDLLISKLDLATKTIALLEERLSSTEDRLSILESTIQQSQSQSQSTTTETKQQTTS